VPARVSAARLGATHPRRRAITTTPLVAPLLSGRGFVVRFWLSVPFLTSRRGRAEEGLGSWAEQNGTLICQALVSSLSHDGWSQAPTAPARGVDWVVWALLVNLQH
jgi:hypothetical protein